MHLSVGRVTEMHALIGNGSYLSIKTAQIVACIIQHITNNNNCILGVMRDRCTPGALKLLKMQQRLGKHHECTHPHRCYFHFTAGPDLQFLFNGPGSWTAAVLSDRNSKLTCVLYVCT